MIKKYIYIHYYKKKREFWFKRVHFELGMKMFRLQIEERVLHRKKKATPINIKNRKTTMKTISNNKILFKIFNFFFLFRFLIEEMRNYCLKKK